MKPSVGQRCAVHSKKRRQPSQIRRNHANEPALSPHRRNRNQDAVDANELTIWQRGNSSSTPFFSLSLRISVELKIQIKRKRRKRINKSEMFYERPQECIHLAGICSINLSSQMITIKTERKREKEKKKKEWKSRKWITGGGHAVMFLAFKSPVRINLIE